MNGEGWQDLGANMIEMANEASPTGPQTFCDASGPLAAGESYNCNCPGNVCTNASCNGAGAKCGRTRGGGLPTYDLLGGSWEGHPMTETLTTTYPISRQYGKLGVRCVRPAE